VDEQGAPNNVPVGFRYNPELGTIDIVGMNLSASKKFRNIQRDGRVSFVVDDVLPPWKPRAVEVRGTAEAITGPRAGQVAQGPDDALIRVLPQQIISWGIDSDAYRPNSRKVNG
jgi:pyridoxamine 5'-phosphate oxidase family protein